MPDGSEYEYPPLPDEDFIDIMLKNWTILELEALSTEGNMAASTFSTPFRVHYDFNTDRWTEGIDPRICW